METWEQALLWLDQTCENSKEGILPMLIGTRVHAEGTSPESDGLYISDGLIAWYDGIWNIGTNAHASNATKWANLVNPNYDGARTTSIGHWESNCYVITGQGKPFTVGRLLSDLMLTCKYTVEVVAATTDYTSRQDLIGNYGGQFYNGNGVSFEVNGGASAKGGLRFFNNGNPDISVLEPVFTNNKDPHYIAWTIDSSATAKVVAYADGVEKRTNATSSTAIVSPSQILNRNTVIGGEMLRDTMAFKGSIYVVRFYNRALKKDEVAHNYLVDKKRFGI